MPSPDSYIKWSAYGTLAAILRHNYYWKLTHTVYPNIYVILYGPPAVGKDAPIVFAESLIRSVGNTKLFMGHFSMQAALKRMSEVGRNEKTAEPITGGSCTIMSREIANQFADVDVACKSLTELYDFQSVWTNDILKNEGIQTLKNVCVNLLCASNDVLFRDVFSKQALQGGLGRRLYLVAETKRRHHISPFDAKMPELTLVPKLIEHLEKLSKHKGEIIFDEPAKIHFSEWYYELESRIEADPNGIAGALATSAIKIAMILAAAEYDFDMIISKRHIEKAINEAEKITKNSKIIMPFAGNDNSEGGDKIGPEILRILLKSQNYQIGRETLFRKLIGVSSNIQVINNTLAYLEEHSKFLETYRMGSGDMGFKLSEAFLEEYNGKTKKAKGEGK